MDESTVGRTIERVEEALIKSGALSLPGPKQLREAVELEVVVVESAKGPSSVPKKRRAYSILQR